MSGIDALQGFDYQVSYAVYNIVFLVKNRVNNIASFKFESLNEEEEDFNIIYNDGSIEFIQIKKRTEGNMWTASDIKKVLTHYIKNYNVNTKYTFITNGSANDDVNKLKKYLNGKKQALSKKDLTKFKPDSYSESEFNEVLDTVDIKTLVMVSNNENDLTEVVRKETSMLLKGASFYLKDSGATIYDKLWKYVFDASKQAREISYSDVVKKFEEIGIILLSPEEWLKFPTINDFKGRKKEIEELSDSLQNNNKISVFGISGIGKSYIMSALAKVLNKKESNVCWISFRANMTFDKLIKILGSFIEQCIGIDSYCQEIENKEIGEQIRLLSDVLKINKCYIFLDSYEAARGNSQYLINNVFKNLEKRDLSSIIISTTDRYDLYSEIDLKLKRVKEYTVKEFSYEDITDFYFGSELSEEQIMNIWKNIGGFPVANTLLKEYLLREPVSGIDFSELVALTLEEKNRWIFDKIYKLLSDDEKNVLAYFSTIGYGFSDYEKIIVENDLRVKLKYIMYSLTNKNIILFDGSVYYLHDVMRNLIYEELFDDEKKRIHKLFLGIYEKRLLGTGCSRREEDKFLSSKWGFHISKLYELGVLDDTRLSGVCDLTSQERFDLWGIWRCGFPFEFENKLLQITNIRIKFLEEKSYIKKDGEFWLVNKEIIDIKALYLIEYKVNLDYNAVAMGYIPIFNCNYAFHKQKNTICEWEHCIEFLPLERENSENSCPIFGHNCPEGKVHVKICKDKSVPLDTKNGTRGQVVCPEKVEML